MTTAYDELDNILSHHISPLIGQLRMDAEDGRVDTTGVRTEQWHNRKERAIREILVKFFSREEREQMSLKSGWCMTSLDNVASHASCAEIFSNWTCPCECGHPGSVKGLVPDPEPFVKAAEPESESVGLVVEGKVVDTEPAVVYAERVPTTGGIEALKKLQKAGVKDEHTTVTDSEA